MSGHADGIENIHSAKSTKIASSINLNAEPQQKKKMTDLLPGLLNGTIQNCATRS